MCLRKPDADTLCNCVCVGGGPGGWVLVPRQLYASCVGVGGMAFLDPLFFIVFVGSKVYLAPCSLGV